VEQGWGKFVDRNRRRFRLKQGDASVRYPDTHQTWVFATYEMEHRESLYALPDSTWLPGVPTRGYVGSLSGGWRYAWAEGTAYAISTEDGRVFSLVSSLLHPWLGTFIESDSGELEPFTQLQTTAELREYVVNPLIPNHVLAFRLAGGATVGPTGFFGSYQLGGNIGDAATYATPDERRMLRGYPLGADIGDMYWLSGLEYRMPVWRIERGIATLPVYARTISGTLFLDAGNAFTELESAEDAIDGALVGTGAELRLSMIAGYGIGVSARLGYAIGLTEGGFALGNPEAFYFVAGTSF
jgi:hypothetical protein